MRMAASSSSSYSATKEYDVFISFRGEDTRHNFTSHLYSALSRWSVKAYIDYELNKGDDISPALIQAIQDSSGSLVVFSENYASSKWCLNELLEILKCRKQGHFVIPVFYKIDPSHVRNQTASYAEAFAKHNQDSKISREKFHNWKVALSEAANIVGWDSESRTNWDESKLIQNIVEDVMQKLDHIYQPSQFGLVGIEKRCGHIESLLQKFPVVGIWGMGGIGKTTIARAAFDKLSPQYDSCCFIENVREESERSGLNKLYIRLLSELLKDEIIPFNPHKVRGFKFAMRRLNSRKVFVVLDDVDSFKQLEYLGKEFNFLGLESRMIITTRDKHLLTCLRAKHVIYEVDGLDFEESLHLFRLNAFNENYPEIRCEEITRKFVSCAKGTPLVLKVLGLFLRSKSREEWESAWRRLNKIPDGEIHKVLKLSFDGLSYEEQQIFLDVACFLKGWDKDRVISLLDHYGLFGAIGIRTLQDRGLITINGHIVQMHDLIQEMAWEIVRTESVDEPGRRSLLWDREEVYDVLKYNKGSDAVKGIILDISRIEDLHLSNDAFKKMSNLRFLNFYGNGHTCKLRLPVDIQLFFDKLRYLYWEKYPLQSLPSTFCIEKLVELHMEDSNITKFWKGVQDLVNLKRFNLRGSQKLIELPDLSKAPSLKWVDLSYCTSLYHIHPSILSLHTLESLNLTWCEELKSLHSEVHLKSLKSLDIIGCPNLKEFSLTSEEIRLLNLEGTAIEILHSSIGRCSNLESLNLRNSVKNLPRDLSRLRSLKSLYARGCRELDTLSLQMVLEGLQSLEDLCLSDCSNLSQIPNNIEHISRLVKLSILNCTRLSYIPELPPSIETLNVTNCTSLETILIAKPFEGKKARYYLTNCVKLDERHLSTIVEYANARIKQAVLYKFGSGWNNSHDFLLPINRVPNWFKYWTRQNWISIEIPPCSHLLGFAFCCILSPRLLPNQGKYLSECGCYCYFGGDRFNSRFGLYEYDPSTELISDHVFIWYNPINCNEILDAMKEQRAKGEGTKKLSFEFYVDVRCEMHVRVDNAIKECGVWPIYASEYDNSINDLELSLGSKLGFRTNDIDERKQLFDPTSENFKPSLPPMELEFDDLGPSRTKTGVASLILDHRDQDIPTHNAKQDLLEIDSSCSLNRFSELDCSTGQMEVSLMESKRCQDLDDNQQLQRKRLNRCQHMDELLGGASTSGIGVGCSEFTYSAGSFEVSEMENKIKECGVWSINAPEYDSSMDEMDLDYKVDHIVEQVQFSERRAKDAKRPLFPVELGDKSKRRRDMDDQKIIWSISAPGYDRSIDEMDLDCKIDSVGEQIQFFDPTTKDFNLSLLPMELEFCIEFERCVEIDELEPKKVGKGVEGSAFDHQSKDEQQSPLQTQESVESVSQSFPTHISMQNDAENLSENISCGCLIGLLWKCLWRLFSA